MTEQQRIKAALMMVIHHCYSEADGVSRDFLKKLSRFIEGDDSALNDWHSAKRTISKVITGAEEDVNE